jgi:hypothetical protein
MMTVEFRQGLMAIDDADADSVIGAARDADIPVFLLDTTDQASHDAFFGAVPR